MRAGYNSRGHGTVHLTIKLDGGWFAPGPGSSFSGRRVSVAQHCSSSPVLYLSVCLASFLIGVLSALFVFRHVLLHPRTVDVIVAPPGGVPLTPASPSFPGASARLRRHLHARFRAVVLFWSFSRRVLN